MLPAASLDVVDIGLTRIGGILTGAVFDTQAGIGVLEVTVSDRPGTTEPDALDSGPSPFPLVA